MRLERQDGKRIALWVGERRGRFVWVRSGFDGSKGRMSAVEDVDEAAAQAQLEREIAARLAEGYVVVDPDGKVDGPFRAKARRTPRRLSPAEIGKAIQRGMPTPPATLERLIDAFCEGARTTANLRMARIELDGAEGRHDVRLTVEYARGSGENVDDYDFEGYGFTVHLAVPWPGGSDGVLLDVFADELRLTTPALVERFRRGVHELPAWRELAGASVVEVTADDRG